jgi:PAS domain S-box-containing protein
MRLKAKEVAERIHDIDGIAFTLYVSVGTCRFSEVETLEQQTKKAEVRLLADNDEHISLVNRQARASQIFHLYDNLPISYVVFRVLTDEHGQVTDARIFYVNHTYEKRAGMTSAELLGKRTRELFPTLEESWYDTARRAAIEGENVVERMSFEPTGKTYAMTASQVIHEGYCCFTFTELEGEIPEAL